MPRRTRRRLHRRGLRRTHTHRVQYLPLATPADAHRVGLEIVAVGFDAISTAPTCVKRAARNDGASVRHRPVTSDRAPGSAPGSLPRRRPGWPGRGAGGPSPAQPPVPGELLVQRALRAARLPLRGQPEPRRVGCDTSSASISAPSWSRPNSSSVSAMTMPRELASSAPRR